MDVEINNVIYMELNSGPKIVNSTCGKTINVETIDRDSTVLSTTKDYNEYIITDFYKSNIKLWIHDKILYECEDKC
jgi:hypothetical protein